MKFTDGNWLIRDGITLSPAVQAYDFRAQNNTLIASASTMPLRGRGDMINTTLLTMQFHSPLPGVIGVKLFHFAGVVDHGPHFELNEGGAHVEITENEQYAELKSGSLSVRINKGPQWSVDFYRVDERITGSGFKSMAHVTDSNGDTYMREELDLRVGEWVYGLGERFTSFLKNGQVVDIWNKDGGTSSEQAYKNIPFYVTNKGYGVLVNDPGAVSFEVASEKVKKVQFSVPGESLEYFVIDGPEPKDVLNKYTDLTGKPSLPPAWSFGLWLTTSFTTDYDEATVNSFVDGMAERDLPLHVFHFDCFWMREFHWTDFKWDERVFPDPQGMLKRLKEKGLKICVWINPYIGQRSRLFEEGMKNGYLVKKANGDVWQWNLWQPGMALVDFTNPAACEWFAGYLRELVDMGVDSFKTDFGERIPTDVVYYDGADPVKMHNYYTYLYNKVVFEVLEEKLGKNEAALFARSATVGGQKFPVHWGGDCYADYESMAESLRGGLSLGLAGFGFWSHDIGGFENTAPAHVFKRWLAFGLLSSHSRLHGSSSYRVPWAYDDEAVDVTRFFTKLKCRLMPYMFDTAVQATQQGVPTMRAMFLEFPDDPACDTLDRQYMLGDSLLVAPVFSEKGDVTYYLPEGKWTHLLTGETVEGGKWRKENHNFFSLPLFVRPNSILATGANDTRPDYDYADGAEIGLYQLADGAAVSRTVRSAKGAAELNVTAAKSGNVVTLSAEGAGKPFRVALHGMGEIASVQGGTLAANGTIEVAAFTGKAELQITLK
ncbi:alpha-xylosidase [Paenibacillus macerans]|uniref:alpha-D-xyloside xylohydrolase n=1 Tax=Paenibacillus macerans TaxID=44252 RepID=A0A091A1L4_PAEMA|nr:alpha-xylosidase [Paenibacillus macerans]KFN10191.1 alpha-xylosidase [Paenibacillus macerans]MCY7561009.1 alpha-xylosidase [Paenibacillus macerans]MEC0153572.1 alpha-xylosidase [Paenibacillus macerans]MUG25544.1 alpha-xylosidase [Paenibacillus macerans]UMV47168.1 alpha-xylosidase [Paenibacillus macerans]